VSERLRAGWSEFEYDVEPSWARPAKGIELGPVTAVAAGAGRVYVCHRLQPAVLVFDAAGSPLGSLGADLITDPHGITMDREGNVYVADRDRHVVVVFDANGNVVRELGSRNHAAQESPFNHPADVAVAGDGTIFVADGYGNSRVHVFTTGGDLIRSWGVHGHDSGAFRVPHGIAVGDDGRVYVADRENDRVQVFDAEGRLLDVWGGFTGATDVSIDDAGHIVVSDHVPTLTMLTPQGEVVFRIRSYHDTHAICCEPRGRIFVASTSGRALVAYTPLSMNGGGTTK
jgi:DNA-binding beta-propeller fold protein YncE